MAYDGSVKIQALIDDGILKKQLTKIKSNIATGMKNVGKATTIALAGVTAGISAFTVSSVKNLITFEDKMNEVFTLLPNISDEGMSKMKEQVKSLSTEMGVLPNDVIPAVYQALSAGVPKDNVFDFVKSATKLAQAGVAELDDSVGVLSTAVNSYTKDGLTATQASDMLFTAVKKGVTSIPELATSLGDVISDASTLGVKFGEVTGSVATLTSTMGKGSTSKAITGYKSMLTELGKEGSQVDVAFQNIAGKGFKDFIASGGTLTEAMVILQKASEKQNTTIKNLFSSTEAGSSAQILAGDGFKKLSENIDDMGNSSGASQKAFETMTESTKHKIDEIQSKIAVMKLNFANDFAPAFDTLLGSINGLLDGTKGAVDTFGQTISDLITTFINKVTEMLPDIIRIGVNLVKSLVMGIVEAIPIVIESISYLIGYLIGTIQNNQSTILETGKNILNWLIEGVVLILSKLGEISGTIISTIIKVIKNKKEDLNKNGGNILTWIVDGIKKYLNWLVDVWADIINSFIFGLTGKQTDVKQMGINMLNWIIEGITSLIKNVTEVGEYVVEGFVKGITNTKDLIINSAKDFGNKFLSTIKNVFGIASPSKEMKKIGDFVVKGFNNGINDAKTGALKNAEDFGTDIIDTVEDSVKTSELVGEEAGKSIKNGIETGVSGTAEKVGEELDRTSDKIFSWKDLITSAFKSVIDGFGDIGGALANNELSWNSMGNIALKTLADVLDAIASQLIALAVVNWFNLPLAGAYTGGALVAKTASGYFRSKANSYDVGGIIQGDQLAQIHDGEGFIPKGIMSDAKTNGLMIAPLKNSSNQNITIISQLDGKVIARNTLSHIDNEVGLTNVS